MTEGSVLVDEGSFPTSSNDVADSYEENESVENESEETESSEGEEQVEYTEKGTKLDPNPQSAVHQQLANAKRQIQQMEQVLGNQDLLRRYAEQNGMTLTQAKAEIKEEQNDAKDEIEEISPDSLNTKEDLARAFNQIRTSALKEIRSLKEENQRLRDGFEGVSSSQEAARVYSFMQSEVSTIQEKYPELNPKNQEYDADLEGEIASLYEELDFDPQKNSFRGKVSLVKLTDRVMSAAGKAKKVGSRQAQTEVKVKQKGKVVTGKSESKEAPSSTDPGTAIAQKISKALNG